MGQNPRLRALYVQRQMGAETVMVSARDRGTISDRAKRGGLGPAAEMQPPHPKAVSPSIQHETQAREPNRRWRTYVEGLHTQR